VSLYVRDLGEVFDRCEELGLVWVNPRFKRCARTREEAMEQGMFRILKIVDPDGKGELLELEHEIRSTARSSCPLDEEFK